MSAEEIQSRNPFDRALLGEVPIADEATVAQRAERADAAFRGAWRTSATAERVELLRELRALLLRRHRSIAELVSREQGKPVLEATVSEVFPVLDTLSFLIHRGPRIIRERRSSHFQPFLLGRRASMRRRPYGVWGVIAPWNYPFAIPACQIVTLLFGGNAVLFKPSPLTPLVGDSIVDLCREAGFHEDLVQVVHGGAEVGEAVVRAPEVRAIAFTGGVEAGRRVMELASRGPKKVLLELGGKDPALVFADADLERSARGIAWSGLMNAGQTCASVERVLVEESIRERFVGALVEEMEKVRLGDPSKDDTDVGPLASHAGLEKVTSHVADAESRGATVATGGKRREDLGELFHEPTLILDAPGDSLMARDETFGPVLSLSSFRNEEEAVARANETRFGLTTSLWTRDRRRAARVAPQLDCGVVTTNSHLVTYAESASVWGGTKDSGFGRTHGVEGLLETLETQYVDEEYTSKPEIWWFPYSARFARVLGDLMAFLKDPSARTRLACLLRLVPQLGYLSRHVRVMRLGPGLVKYLR